jgi:hypothetical protein
MNDMYAQYNVDISKGDTSLLKDVHVYSSGLKSYCTKLGADGIEEARRCLGGHGYSLFSGMIDFHRQFLATVTYEGENALLTVRAPPFATIYNLPIYTQCTYTILLDLIATSVTLPSQAIQGCYSKSECSVVGCIKVHPLIEKPELLLAGKMFCTSFGGFV